MKTLGILLAASMAAACASHPAPDANTGTSPEPMADGTMQNADGAALATTPAPAATPARTTATDSTGMPVVGPTDNAVAANNNVAATPAPAPAPTQPDNSAVNKRDKDGSSLTPMNQGTSEGDRKITQQIRQAVMKDSSLSFTAKNVKIITINGKVTLRGPVKTAQERSSIEAEAKSVAGVNQVENLLEAKN
ncbi:MAG: BON domain-containing protein [Polyangiaceae bacterium]